MTVDRSDLITFLCDVTVMDIHSLFCSVFYYQMDLFVLMP